MLKKIWRFLWHDDSPLSWIVSLILAFIIVKFLFYPGLGFVMGTTHPIVAVISGSMEHNGDFDDWWNSHNEWYESGGMGKENFSGYSFRNGFDKGDIMVLIGEESKSINIGDVIVFRSTRNNPVIHRVVKKWIVEEKFLLQTKGDNNPDVYDQLGENAIEEQKVIGKAVFRIPKLGWIKILFTELIT